jgi:hypothetical protein
VTIKLETAMPFRPPMLTADQVAARWQVHPSTVYRMAAWGRAIAFGFGLAAERLLLDPASPLPQQNSREVRFLIVMTQLNAAFQPSFPALNGRHGADYDALE